MIAPLEIRQRQKTKEMQTNKKNKPW